MAELGAGFEEDADRDLQQSVEIDPQLRSQTMPNILLAAVETTHGQMDKALSRLLDVQTAAERGSNLLRLQFAAELGRLRLRRGEYAESRKLFEEARQIGENSWSRTAAEGRVLWPAFIGAWWSARSRPGRTGGRPERCGRNIELVCSPVAMR